MALSVYAAFFSVFDFNFTKLGKPVAAVTGLVTRKFAFVQAHTFRISPISGMQDD
jgi:hypothetical protein